jgi:hypothetical protein
VALKRKRSKPAPAPRPKPQAPTTAGSQRAFLLAYANTGNVRAACEAAKVHRRTHYKWLEDPAYSAQFEDAKVDATDALEREARRRALEGVLEPVFQIGEKVGSIRKFSDTLLIFLLKGLKPDTYRERVDTRHSGNVVSTVAVRELTDDELAAELAKYAAKAAAGGK